MCHLFDGIFAFAEANSLKVFGLNGVMGDSYFVSFSSLVVDDFEYA